jgi:predicted metal-binding membrane protein
LRAFVSAAFLSRTPQKTRAFAGVLAFFGLVLFEQVLVLAGNDAGWLGAAIFVTAGVYQLTSFKVACLRHCRSPMSLLVHYTSFRGTGD